MSENELREYLRKLGRRGAAATNSKLTPSERAASARRAAKARWAKFDKAMDEAEAAGRKSDKVLARLERRVGQTSESIKALEKLSRANARKRAKQKKDKANS